MGWEDQGVRKLDLNPIQSWSNKKVAKRCPQLVTIGKLWVRHWCCMPSCSIRITPHDCHGARLSRRYSQLRYRSASSRLACIQSHSFDLFYSYYLHIRIFAIGLTDGITQQAQLSTFRSAVRLSCIDQLTSIPRQGGWPRGMWAWV